MDERSANWRRRADDLWDAEGFPYAAAASLAADIVLAERTGEVGGCARAAYPLLRQAASGHADGFERAIAKRRFAMLRQELHLAAPSTAHRRIDPAPSEARCRDLLGLPSRGAVSGPAVQAAYRSAARTAHPDQGGSAEAFTQLVAARDALLQHAV